MFVDEIQISVRSGHGGKGCVSYRRERFLPHGGPDGGDGGKGGDIIFKVNAHLKSLLDFSKKRQYSGEDGRPGGKQRKTGRNGKDLVLEVPVGTLLKDEQGQILYDLCLKRHQVCLLKGGLGGRGNHFFKNSRVQAPSFAQEGQSGQEMLIQLELKLLADLGLVGFPNVGKSTLMSRVSRARPKVADYPFTTLRPHLCVIEDDLDEPLVVADLPGLLVDAHKGVGLGWQFLRHIERTKGLVYVLDASAKEPLHDYHLLRKELLSYQQSHPVLKVFHQELDFLEQPLYHRPHIVVLNKIDVLKEHQLDKILLSFKEQDISAIPLSARDGLGFQKLLSLMKQLVSRRAVYSNLQHATV